MQEGLGRGMNDYRGLEMASRSLDPRDAGPMAPGTPFPAYGVGQQPSAGLPDSMLPMDLSPGTPSILLVLPRDDCNHAKSRSTMNAFDIS